MKKFKFNIEKDDTDCTYIQFNPKDSNVHGFEDDPPETWDEVYKTYLSFGVYYEFNGKKEELLKINRNEGDSLLRARIALEEIIQGKAKDYDIAPFGEGETWEIKKYGDMKDYYSFTVIDYNGQAFRFYLDVKKIKKLHKTIDEFLEYMLKNSQGI